MLVGLIALVCIGALSYFGEARDEVFNRSASSIIAAGG
jgi:Flp pilus assembly pilin Flp